MKKLIKSFTTFSRTERMGLVALCSLLLLLLTVRTTMSMWVKPSIDSLQEKKIIAAWEKYKRSQPLVAISDTVDQQKNDYQDAFDENPTPLPAIIDLNT